MYSSESESESARGSSFGSPMFKKEELALRLVVALGLGGGREEEDTLAIADERIDVVTDAETEVDVADDEEEEEVEATPPRPKRSFLPPTILTSAVLLAEEEEDDDDDASPGC